MKCRIKAGDLGRLRENLHKSLNAPQIMRLVERSEGI